MLPNAVPASGTASSVQRLPRSIHTVILLFRNGDLRLHDNPALLSASAESTRYLVPLYIYDDRDVHGISPNGFPRLSQRRKRFIDEAVHELHTQLKTLSSGLLVKHGRTRDILGAVLEKIGASERDGVGVVTSIQVGTEEHDRLLEVRKATGRDNVFELWNHSTLHDVRDLPFEVGSTETPRVFTEYRKWVEKSSRIREPLGRPGTLPPIHPRLLEEVNGQDLRPKSPSHHDPRSVVPFTGGCVSGLQRMNDWIFTPLSGTKSALASYKATRNTSGVLNCSTKFSPFLALGCLSPRTIFEAIRRYEEQSKISDENTYWLVFELMTRDFWIWTAAKEKERLYAWNGYAKDSDKALWKAPRSMGRIQKELLRAWIEGMTGVPFVDAAMRELKETGYCSNRSRQNVASFFIHELDMPDWRIGAEYFESVLTDYDPAANWCNWAYIAGVGSDPRGGRRFNTIKQANEYDPEAHFTKKWCPSLKNVPSPDVFEVFRMRNNELKRYGVTLGSGYPEAVVEIQKFVPKGEWNGAKKGEVQGSRKTGRVRDQGRRGRGRGGWRGPGQGIV